MGVGIWHPNSPSIRRLQESRAEHEKAMRKLDKQERKIAKKERKKNK